MSDFNPSLMSQPYLSNTFKGLIINKSNSLAHGQVKKKRKKKKLN
jgi:hypothetical protein